MVPVYKHFLIMQAFPPSACLVLPRYRLRHLEEPHSTPAGTPHEKNPDNFFSRANRLLDRWEAVLEAVPRQLTGPTTPIAGGMTDWARAW